MKVRFMLQTEFFSSSEEFSIEQEPYVLPKIGETVYINFYRLIYPFIETHKERCELSNPIRLGYDSEHDEDNHLDLDADYKKDDWMMMTVSNVEHNILNNGVVIYVFLKY